MNRKGIIFFGAVISLSLFVAFGAAMVQKEFFNFQTTKFAIEKVVDGTKRSTDIFPNWMEISIIKEDLPISIKKFIGEMVGGIDFSSHSVFLSADTGKIIEVTDSFMLADNVLNLELVSPAEAAEYYKNLLQITADVNSESPFFRYLGKFVLLLGLSNFPLLIAWLFSSAIMKFSFIVFMLGIIFLFVSAQRARAEDKFAGASIEYSTSGAGKKNDAWMLLHLRQKKGLLAILEDGKFWLGAGPYATRGNFFSLLSLGAVTEEKDGRVKIGSANAVNFTLWSKGKFSYLFLGILNKPIDSRPMDLWYKNVFYWDVPTLGGFFEKAKVGARIDQAVFQEDRHWNNSFSYGPIIKFYVKELMIQIHYSFNKKLTTQWEMAL